MASSRAPRCQGALSSVMATSGDGVAGDLRAIAWRWATQAPCSHCCVLGPGVMELRAGCSSQWVVSCRGSRVRAATPSPCSWFSHGPPLGRSPCPPMVVRSVDTRGQRAASWLNTTHAPAGAFFNVASAPRAAWGGAGSLRR